LPVSLVWFLLQANLINSHWILLSSRRSIRGTVITRPDWPHGFFFSKKRDPQPKGIMTSIGSPKRLDIEEAEKFLAKQKKIASEKKNNYHTV
jgi:hypothetical protein